MTLIFRLAKAARHSSIQRKLALIVALTCGIGIVAAGVALFTFQIYTLRVTFHRDIAALSEMVATNLSGAVAFEDRKAAVEVLGSLKAKPSIESALVRQPNGTLLASAGIAAGTGIDARFAGGADGAFDGWNFHVESPIRVDKEIVGTLALRANFRPTFFEALWRFLLVFGAICAGALIIALAVGRSLRRLITEPVRELSVAAAQIGERRDYGVRVEKLGNDELGALTDAFNQMLERLQAADRELRGTNSALTKEIEQRRRLQSELLEASRLAGMAEVATGVLHNVGNVLNSVNVSAGLMREQLEASRLGMLGQTADLLTAQGEQVGTFLTSDERGRRIPGFLGRLAREIGGEHQRLRDELVGLSRNIEHIKEIVAMQQSYAKASAVLEKVDANELFEHSCSIHQASLDRHQVRVVTHFPVTATEIETDRHKVLQILTNFVANAIHATKVNPDERREITLGLATDDPARIALSVRDNGVGIPAENLAKIFQQGFTTRRDGHGFGLHSGILVAKSLGGSIEVASEGPGKGALFTLWLPRSQSAIPSPGAGTGAASTAPAAVPASSAATAA